MDPQMDTFLLEIFNLSSPYLGIGRLHSEWLFQNIKIAQVTGAPGRYLGTQCLLHLSLNDESITGHRLVKHTNIAKCELVTDR